MNLNISRVSMQYSDGQLESVQVHFDGRNEPRTYSINGYVPLTAEEYEGNEAIPALEALVRSQIAEKIVEGNSEE